MIHNTPLEVPDFGPADTEKLDPRVARSRSIVGSTLLEMLADGRLYKEITISELAAAAGLTRKTFYKHFDSIDAVVRGLAFQTFNHLLNSIDDQAFVLPLAQNGLGLAVFEKLREHLEVLEPLATSCPSELFLEPARETVRAVVFARIQANNDLGPIREFDRDYLAQLTGSTLHGAIVVWANRGFTDEPEDIADFVMEMLGPIADRIFGAVRRDSHS